MIGTPEFRIELLSPIHQLEAFDCGQPALNRYLVRHAWMNQRANAARTYVALFGQEVVGFHTLVVGEVAPEEAPLRIRKGLANHPVPLMLLAAHPLCLYCRKQWLRWESKCIRRCSNTNLSSAHSSPSGFHFRHVVAKMIVLDRQALGMAHHYVYESHPRTAIPCSQSPDGDNPYCR